MGTFSNISVGIATARSTTRRVRCSLTRRSDFAGACSQSTRFSGLMRDSDRCSTKPGVTHKMIHRRIERSAKRSMCLPRSCLTGRNRRSVRLCQEKAASATFVVPREPRTYDDDKPPVYILADRGTGQQYVIAAKAAGESTIRLLFAASQEELLTICTDGFHAYEPLEEARYSTVNTSSMMMMNTPTTRYTSTPARAMRR